MRFETRPDLPCSVALELVLQRSNLPPAERVPVELARWTGRRASVSCQPDRPPTVTVRA
jgi:hypothetical protein